MKNKLFKTIGALLLVITLLGSCKQGTRKQLEVHFVNGGVDTLSVVTFSYYVSESNRLYVSPNSGIEGRPIAHGVIYVKEID